MFSEVLRPEVAEYDYFTPAFYAIWGNDSDVMAQARAINEMYNTYLYAFGFKHPWQLDPSLQEFLNEHSKITIKLGEADD